MNLEESEYIYNYGKLRFYFSSEFYLKKFSDMLEEYIKLETKKLEVKYGINIEGSLYFAISLYKRIEKRGFKITDMINNIDLLDEKIIFVMNL